MIRHCAGAGEFGPSAIDAAVAQQMSFDVTRLQVRKRRPKQYPLMTRPRAELRKLLLKQRPAA